MDIAIWGQTIDVTPLFLDYWEGIVFATCWHLPNYAFLCIYTIKESHLQELLTWEWSLDVRIGSFCS